MRTNFKPKPVSYPQPVYIVGTYDKDGVPNAMNAAWGMISDFTQISLSLSADHKTVKNFLVTKAFTVSIGTEEQVKACDYVGVVTGNKVTDKFAKAGFHATKSAFVNAPIIDELPMTLECELISYSEETGICVGEIKNISADESILTDGKIDPAKLKPISFDPVHNTYLTTGPAIAKAFVTKSMD